MYVGIHLRAVYSLYSTSFSFSFVRIGLAMCFSCVGFINYIPPRFCIMFFILIRRDVKIQVLAIASFCKSLQTLATTGLLTLSQVCQPLASNGNQSPFSRYTSNDILITLTAH